MNKSKTEQVSPWDCIWPPEELETGSCCPVCMSPESYSLYDGLVDDVFFVAPGRWTLKKCNRCASAYVSPRPMIENMSKAYGNYYTHKTGAVQEKIADISFLRFVRRILANGYLNSKYGSKRKPSIQIGAWILQVFPRLTSVLDAQYRFLPKPLCGQSLLDIGCGKDSSIVRVLRQNEYKISEYDPYFFDDKKLLEQKYDYITSCEVIEHFYNPKKEFKLLKSLLKDNGTLYLMTGIYRQNIDFSKWWYKNDLTHVFIYKEETFEWIKEEFGFKNLKIKENLIIL